MTASQSIICLKDQLFSIEILIECKENRAATTINSANIDFVS